MTYGCSYDLPVKAKHVQKPPAYGPFKIGDPAHQGHNKCFGARNESLTEYRYEEERETDPVKY